MMRSKNTRVLITGVAGFAGSHLADYLAGFDNIEVHGILRSSTDRANISQLGDHSRLHVGDIRDAAFVSGVVASVRPEYLMHLAAQTSVATAWQAPMETLVGNLVGQSHLLDAARRLCPDSRVLVVGSAEEYGLVRPEELPLDEATPFRPNSPYAVSKIAQDMLGYQYFLAYSMPVVRVRAFNHIGPRQRETFAASGFARQLAEVEAGLREPVVHVGNLDARRDITDVRDIARAYWAAIVDGEPGEVYNIGSGRSVAIRELLDILLAECHLTMSIELDPKLLRPSDVPDLVCDPTRFRRRTGWKPRIDLRETLTDLLNYWRGVVGGHT